MERWFRVLVETETCCKLMSQWVLSSSVLNWKRLFLNRTKVVEDHGVQPAAFYWGS